MVPDARQSLLSVLRSSQNPDGGWGYFPKRQSWLEPTCYALLALHQDSASQPNWNRGWDLLRSWQLPDGSWRPSAAIPTPCWATALCITLHCVRGVFDAAAQRGAAWMLSTKGSEGTWFERAVNIVRPLPLEYDRRWKGWPWSPGAASWIEPTSHSILALRKASPRLSQLDARPRITEAERMMLDRRSSDGGWNHGNRRVYQTDLPSYPETTAVALLGLQGCPQLDVNPALQVAQRHLAQTRSPLARAWLTIALRNYGQEVSTPVPAPGDLGGDLMLTALHALATPNGGHQWLKPA